MFFRKHPPEYMQNVFWFIYTIISSESQPLQPWFPVVMVQITILALSLPWAPKVAKLGYPFISIYSNRESLGSPRESPEI